VEKNTDIRSILLKYWGYSSFRLLQEDIINSVLEGKDTLALLPTGGGKSVCFQVPALAIDGLCVVVTPLIALMKDQVENLKNRGIRAVAIHSGMTSYEIEVVINNCVYDDVKFLYLSPERLETDIIIHNIDKMNVNLLAVDEAHCISQWGYDFRPSYLKIAEIRKKLPGVPVLALTATATTDVIPDIQEKLEFSKPNLFRLSFERKNLTYVVLKEEDKLNRLLKVVNNLKGSGIVYVRSRRRSVEIRNFLNNNHVMADFYHAGLDQKTRDIKQNLWMRGESRVMVATNAFGMGIDKPDVRFVAHVDIPDNLEAYFQEAGRAGRDGKLSYAVLLYDDSDLADLNNHFETTFPPIDMIKRVYQALGNYLQLAVGSGKDVSFDFDIIKFCENYNFNRIIAYNSLKFLEKEGFIMLQDFTDADSKIHLRVNKEDIYKFQVENPKYDKFVKVLLRSYSGLFTDFVRISESQIASRLGINESRVYGTLQTLEKFNILTYIKRKTKPQLTFLTERIDAKDIFISDEHYRIRKESAKKRLDAVIKYISTKTKCRNSLLLEYFGETETKRCGRCDVCIERNKIELSELEFDNILNQIKPHLTEKPCTVNELAELMEGVREDNIIKVIQWLLDNDKLIYNKDKKLLWK
jgi:ATP-dependent DNA helicase RecQ